MSKLPVVETDMPLEIEYRAQWFDPDPSGRLGPFGKAARIMISP